MSRSLCFSPWFNENFLGFRQENQHNFRIIIHYSWLWASFQPTTIYFAKINYSYETNKFLYIFFYFIGECFDYQIILWYFWIYWKSKTTVPAGGKAYNSPLNICISHCRIFKLYLLLIILPLCFFEWYLHHFKNSSSGFSLLSTFFLSSLLR